MKKDALIPAGIVGFINREVELLPPTVEWAYYGGDSIVFSFSPLLLDEPLFVKDGSMWPGHRMVR